MSDSEQKPQRRVTSGPRRDVPEQLRRADANAQNSDVKEEQAAHADEDGAIEASRALGHEPSSDVNVRRLVQLGVVTVVIGAATIAALYGMFVIFLARPQSVQPPSALGLPQPTPPGPRLQTDPVGDWDALHATEEAMLSSYGWTDRNAGKVRIPIDRAMDLLAQRGLPVAPGSTRQFSDQTANLDSSGGRDPNATPNPSP